MARQQAISSAKEKMSESYQSERPRVTTGMVGRYVAVVVVVCIAIAPLYWMFITSVKSRLELNTSPPTLIPHTCTLENYVAVLTNSAFFLPDLRNSAIISIVTTLLAF